MSIVTAIDAIDRIQTETEFVKICLEVEAEHGGQIFIDRSPHCSMWSARVFWPRWENPERGGVCEQISFHAILKYDSGDGGISDLAAVRELLTSTIHKLRDREDVAKFERIVALKQELTKLEAE